jgi:hypothetical protein
MQARFSGCTQAAPLAVRVWDSKQLLCAWACALFRLLLDTVTATAPAPAPARQHSGGCATCMQCVTCEVDLSYQDPNVVPSHGHDATAAERGMLYRPATGACKRQDHPERVVASLVRTLSRGAVTLGVNDARTLPGDGGLHGSRNWRCAYAVYSIAFRPCAQVIRPLQRVRRRARANAAHGYP